MYLLDTDTLTEFASANTKLSAKLLELPSGQLSISIVSVGEVLQGWLAQINRNQGKPQGEICKAYGNFARSHEFLQRFNVVHYTLEMESIYQTFTPAIKRVGTNDCRIAATAIAHGLIVVTRNTRDFTKIPNIKVEDWTVRVQ